MTDSQQRVVWITGAAGGLGQGLVNEFAPSGWRVAATHHCQSSLVETNLVWPDRADVTSKAQVEHVVCRLIERWSRIDLLVNNAGATADQPLWQMSESDWDNVVAVNLKGAFLCSQAVVGQMIRQQKGQIINIASFAALHGNIGQANYAAAKAGLLGLTMSLAKELGPHNVRVNAILPGVLPTPMTARLKPEQLAQFAAANALGRLGSVAEVARFIAFLATLENVSGQIFQLDSRI